MSTSHIDARLDAFAERVRTERVRRGLTQAEAAELVAEARGRRMSAVMLGAIERRQRRPSLAQAIAIADALAVPVSSLLGEPTGALDAFGADLVAALAGVFESHGVREQAPERHLERVSA